MANAFSTIGTPTKTTSPLGALAATFTKPAGVSQVPSSAQNPYGLSVRPQSLAPSISTPTPVRAPTAAPVGVMALQNTGTTLSNNDLNLLRSVIQPGQVQGMTATAPGAQPIQSPYQPFTIDTSNLTSDHLAGDNTPSSVLSYADRLQNQYNSYLTAQQPLQDQYAQASLYSPDELTARQNLLTLNNGLGQGLEALRGQGLGTPLSIVRGNQEKLQNQTALQQTAASNTLSNLEAIRLNNLSALQSQIGFNQTNYTNQFNASKEAQAAGIQQGQLDISQQTANQNRYDYQQITTPEGFPVIQVTDKLTGQSVGTISPHSDQGQAIIQSGGLSQGNGVINGYNISSYATDPNHEAAVGSIYNQITSAVGGVTTPQQAQSVISALVPNSPITGAMVLSSAQKYGVDPNLMIALMQQDSSLGTQGKAVKTFNPGNVGNTDSGATVNQGSWQNGVDAVAKWLSTHKATDSSAQLATLPPILQQYAVQGPDNSLYIREDKVAANQIAAVKVQAAQNGIPVLSTDEVDKIHSIDVTKQNLASLQDLTQKVLKSGISGRIVGLTTNKLKDYFQTDPTGIGSFNSYRDTAINTIQALAGGAGSGLRLTTGEIETAVGNMPTINDNLETAQQKIAKVNSFLDKWTKEILPNSQPGGQQVASNSDPLGLGF